MGEQLYSLIAVCLGSVETLRADEDCIKKRVKTKAGQRPTEAPHPSFGMGGKE